MKITPDLLRSFSSSNHPEGEKISHIMAAALNAVEPFEAVSRSLHLDGRFLIAANLTYDLSKFKRIVLVGAGKAAVPMAASVSQIFGASITSGLVITKQGYTQTDNFILQNIRILEAGHPLPDQRGVLGSHKIIQLLKSAQSEDLILCLISGGGSALMTAPMPGIQLEEVQILTSRLLACGATIDEINTIRKHIDQVKGGGLVAQAGQAHWITLILSDVIGDPLDLIASGPTAPDASTYEDAFKILKQYELLDQVPGSIISHLKQGIQTQIPETLKPGHSAFDRVNNMIVGNNYLAADAALREASSFGYHTLLLTTSLQGEASQAGKFIAAIAQQITRSNQPISRPACLILGGETTVTLHGKGCGGRNQELALGAVNPIAGLENIFLITLATDGGDGPTDAAGAVVTGQTLARALSLGIHPNDYLTRNDSYHFFQALDDLLKPGPTLTNVGDLAFLFAC